MKSVLKMFLKLIILLGLIFIFLLGIPFSLMIYPIYIINRPLCIRLSTFFTYSIWSLMSMMFNLSSSVEGGDVLNDETYFIITNHLGAMDFMLINEIGRKSGMLQHLKYVIKSELKMFPVFYHIVVYAGFLVLKRRFETDKKNIIRYFDLFKNNSIPMWFILYPEGMRYTDDLRSASWEYCDKKGVPRLNNVLFPRYKGFKLICEQLKHSRIKNIMDVTLFYNGDKIPPLWKFILGDPQGSFRCDIRTIPIDEIEDHEQFLYDTFQRKDSLITQWRSERDSMTQRNNKSE